MSISKLTINLLLGVLIISNTYAQSIQKRYEKGYSFYKKNDYKNVIEIYGKLITESRNVNDPNDLFLLHNAALTLYYIFKDPTNSMYDNELSQTYLFLSKKYLDLLFSQKTELKEYLKPRYDSVKLWVTQNSALNNKKNVIDNQKDIVTVVTTGEAKTSELAINSALRKAIEQVLGSFITSKTKIINDSIINDELISISSGNIISFTVISEINENNLYHVVVSSTVSPEKIVLSASAKTGHQFELSGSLYYQNILKEDFYKKQELIALQNFYDQWKYIEMFDHKIQEGEMFRYHTEPSFGSGPRYSNYLNSLWTYYKRDLYTYNNKEMIALLKSDNVDSEEKWDRLPRKYGSNDLYQIPYKIMVTPNENFYKFIEAYTELLHVLSIKNINDYQTKFGDPIIFWKLIYRELLFAIQNRLPYSDPMQYSNWYGQRRMIPELREGHVALRNENSLKLLDSIYSIVLNQNDCASVYVDGIKDLTFPPAFDYSQQESKTIPRNRSGVIEFPYPTDGYNFNEVVFILLTFTKDELSKLNKKISFSFSLK
jgi:hypothetical protein